MYHTADRKFAIIARVSISHEFQRRADQRSTRALILKSVKT